MSIPRFEILSISVSNGASASTVLRHHLKKIAVKRQISIQLRMEGCYELAALPGSHNSFTSETDAIYGARIKVMGTVPTPLQTASV